MARLTESVVGRAAPVRGVLIIVTSLMPIGHCKAKRRGRFGVPHGRPAAARLPDGGAAIGAPDRRRAAALKRGLSPATPAGTGPDPGTSPAAGSARPDEPSPIVPPPRSDPARGGRHLLRCGQRLQCRRRERHPARVRTGGRRAELAARADALSALQRRFEVLTAEGRFSARGPGNIAGPPRTHPDIQRRRSATNRISAQRIGIPYCRPPLVHRAFWPRLILSREPSPTFFSNASP
jgi:hypothetical protein